MKQEKIVKRIRKLLEMASDASSPNEAAIAAKRARVLMDKHQIRRSEVLTEEPVFGTNDVELGNAGIPDWIQWIATSTAQYNDCIAKVNNKNRDGQDCEFKVVFLGYQADTIVAQHTVEYLISRSIAMMEIRGMTNPGEKFHYLNGVSRALAHRLDAMTKEREKDLSAATGRELVVIKKQLVEQHFGEAEYRESAPRIPDPEHLLAYYMGEHDGENLGLDPQLEN